MPTVGPGGAPGGGSHGGIACCLLVGVGVVWSVGIVVLIVVVVIVVFGFDGVMPFQVHRCFDHAGH